MIAVGSWAAGRMTPLVLLLVAGSVATVADPAVGSTPVAPRGGLDLAAPFAFAIGTDTNVESAEELGTAAFNDSLGAARVRGEPWTRSALGIALRFADPAAIGARQSVRVETSPPEWEPGRALHWVRVTVEEGGWLDDAVAGQRTVLWLVPDADGELVVERALWARLCRRPLQRFYTSGMCP